MMTNVTGTVAPGFEAVRDAFEVNFSDHGDIGAGVSVFVEGECVVDLVGGWAVAPTEDSPGEPYTDETLQLVFSTTKGAAAICAHLLAQRGLLDFDAKVADIWPEYAAAGKHDTTIGMLISHRGGVPVIDRNLSLAEALDIEPVVKALAEQKPLWEPGTAHGYHALTYGWLIGEVVRRIDGRSIGRFFAEEIAAPLDLEFWIGLPPEQQIRVAPLVAGMPGEGQGGFDPSQLDPEILPLIKDLMEAFLDPNSVSNRALGLNGTFALAGEELTWNLPEVRASEIPAANGVTNARSLAKLYAACVSEVDGVRILDEETVAAARVEQSHGRDQTLVMPTRFGLGFFLPSKFSPLMGDGSFGHAGAGGSLGFGNVDKKVGFGYVMNKMGGGLSNDPRTQTLIEAVKDAIG